MTNNLYLRPWRHEDVAQLASIANNRNIWNNVRDRFPHPYTIQDALNWVSHTNKENPPQSLAIIHGQQVAGSIGAVPKEDVHRKSIEVGYFVGEPYWGQGIATAAVALLIDHIQKHFDAVRLYAEVFETNIASMKVLEKNGFHLEGIRHKSVIKNNRLMNDHVWVRFLS